LAFAEQRAPARFGFDRELRGFAESGCGFSGTCPLKIAIARGRCPALLFRHQNDPGHPPVRAISLRMKPTNARSAEPSSGPGDPSPKNPDRPESSMTEGRVDPVAQTAPPEAAIPPLLLEDDDPEPGPINEEPKFALSPAGGSAPRPPAPGELPRAYGTGRLLLMASDPVNLYAHWDLDDNQRTRFAGLSTDGLLRLRIRRENAGDQLESELPVDPQSSHSFIRVHAAGGRYVAELGYQPPSGQWQSIVSSSPVVTPAAPPAQPQAVQFGTLIFASSREDPPSAEQRAGPAKPAEPASETAGPPPLERQFPLPPPLGPPATQTPGATGELPGEVRPEGALAAPAGAILLRPGKIAAQELFPYVVPAQAGQWTQAQEQALAEIIGDTVVQRQILGSQEIEALIQGEWRLQPPPVLTLVQPQAVLKPVSSAELSQAPPVAHGFWLNVNAELILYGATEPGAQVTLGGQPIPVRPDGTFSCRFALPDGFHPLSVAALSKAGELRQVMLDFSRKTAYSEGAGSEPPLP
jgi:hypothetical protein